MGGTYWFGCGEIHNEGCLKALGPEIETFLGPEMATSAASALGSKKPEKWISLHPNQYGQPHIKNRCIGNFMDKRFQGPFRDGLMCVYSALH